MNFFVNLMQLAPRCTAHSKRTGRPCRSPAVKGYAVCRMHGARGGAPTGSANGRFRHGGRTKEAMAEGEEFMQLIRESKEFAELL